MRKRGLSVVVSAFLLILLVLIMAGIIFFWSRGITGEAITIQGENIALVCYNIFFQFSYNNENLYIINDGNVNIYSVKLVMSDEDNSEVKDIKELSANWPDKGLGQGEIFSDQIIFDSNVKEVTLVPILIGDEESKRQEEYSCENKAVIIEIN